MKNNIKLTAITLFIAIGIITILATSQINTANAQSGSTRSTPRALYVQNCAKCHGADGKAQTTLGKKLGADDISGGITTSKVIRTATNGRGDMPSFKKRLTKAQISAIAGYVHSL